MPKHVPPGTLLINGDQPLGPQTGDDELSDLARRFGGAVRLGPGGSTVTFDAVNIAPGPDRFHVTVHSEQGRVHAVDLVLRAPDDGPDWKNWALDRELARKARHEAWARLAFGLPLEPLPLAYDVDKPPVLPHDITPEHPRTAAYPWGEVGSYCDSKAGFSFLRIRYARMRDLTPGLA